MASKYPLAFAATGSGAPVLRPDTTRANLDAFIEYNVHVLQCGDLHALAHQPPVMQNFMQAYVFARCLPLAAGGRDRTLDIADDEDFDDALYAITTAAELYLNTSVPASPLEALLLIDLVNSIEDGPCHNTAKIPVAIENFLFRLIAPGADGLRGDSANLTDPSSCAGFSSAV